MLVPRSEFWLVLVMNMSAQTKILCIKKEMHISVGQGQQTTHSNVFNLFNRKKRLLEWHQNISKGYTHDDNFNGMSCGRFNGSNLEEWPSKVRRLFTIKDQLFHCRRKIDDQNTYSQDCLCFKRLSARDECRTFTRFHRLRGKRNAADSAPELMYTFIEQAVQPGAHISLKCSATGEPSPRFIWTLDGQPIVSNHRTNIGESVESGSYTVGQLNISSVRVEDGGYFSCKATNIQGSVQHSARLNVYGPPYIRSIGIIKAITGTDVTIICPYYGFPISSVKWEGANGRSLSGQRYSTTDGALLVRNVDPTSDAGSYICEVQSPGGELARRELKLHVASPPSLSPLMIPPDLKAGQRTQLTCTVVSGDMPVHFSWLKDSSQISSVLQLEERTADFFSILIFKTLSSNHGGSYTCVATNSAGSANISAELLIKVPPYWRTEPTDVAVLLAGAINVPCEAKGHPTPLVHWTKMEGGTEVTLGSWAVEPINNPSTGMATSTRSSGSALVVKSARPSNSGQYTCRASNGVLPDLVKHIMVTVHEPARFESASQNVSSVRGANVKLICSALGETPLQVIWSRGGRPLPHQDYRMSISETSSAGGVRSQFSLERAERKDSGLYRCQASNSYGRSEHFIHLAIQEPPEPPSDVRVSEVASRSIRLSWRRPYDGNSGVNGYTLQYRRVVPISGRFEEEWDGTDAHNVSVPVENVDLVEGSEEHGTITGLIPGTTYQVRVFTRSSLFSSPPSTSVHAVTLAEPPSAAPGTPRVLSHVKSKLVVEWQTPPKSTWNGELLGYIISWWATAGLSETQSPYMDKLYPSHIDQSRTYSNYYANSFGEYRGGMVEQATVRGSGSTKYTIVGLEHYTRYSIVLKAFNNAGLGPGSTPITTMTLESVPSAPPVDIRCRALSSQSLKVEWSPPLEYKINGALLGYKLVYRPIPSEGIISWNRPSDANDQLSPGNGPVEVKRISAQETQLLALRKAHNYSIQVLAYTNPGDGAISPVIFCSTEDDVPGPPDDVKTASTSGSSLMISWLPPSKPNGFLTHYNVYYREVGSNVMASSQRISPMNSQDSDEKGMIGLGGFLELRQLSERSHYEIWVTASNTAGESEHSRHVTQATSRVSARVVPFSLMVRVPEGTSFLLACMSNSMTQARWSKRPTTRTRFHRGDQPHLLFEEMDPSLAGNYTCQALNSYGSDDITYTVICLKKPSPPVLSLQYSNRESARVIWRNDASTNDVLGYTLSYWQIGSDSSDRSMITVSGESNGYTIQGLACYATFVVTLAVHTARGDSAFSKLLQFSTEDNADSNALSRSAIWSNASAVIVDVRSILQSTRTSCPVRLLRVQYRRADVSDEWRDAHIGDAAHMGEVCICGVRAAAWWAVRVWSAAPSSSPSKAITLFTHTTTPDGEAIPRPAHFLLESNEAAPSGGEIITDLANGTNTLTLISAILAAIAVMSTCAVLYFLIKRKTSLWSCPGDITISESRDCVASSTTEGKSCSGDSRGCHDYSAAPRLKLTPSDDIYEISPYATFQVGGQPANNAPTASAAATLDHSLQFRTFGHRENEDAPVCRRHARSRTPRDHYDKQRMDCEMQQLSRYEKFQPRHRAGGSYCMPLSHTGTQATASLSEVYTGDSSGDSTTPPRLQHS